MAELLKTLGYLSPGLAAGAVLRVYADNLAVSPLFGFGARAPEWPVHSELRADLFKRTRDWWCRLAKKDFTWFPYSEDYVARLYARVCRRTDAELTAWAGELAAALPHVPHLKDLRKVLADHEG